MRVGVPEMNEGWGAETRFTRHSGGLTLKRNIMVAKMM